MSSAYLQLMQGIPHACPTEMVHRKEASGLRCRCSYLPETAMNSGLNGCYVLVQIRFLSTQDLPILARGTPQLLFMSMVVVDSEWP